MLSVSQHQGLETTCVAFVTSLPMHGVDSYIPWRNIAPALDSCASLTGLGPALVQSGWTMLTAVERNHAYSPVQGGQLGLTTVPTLKMWRFTVRVFVLQHQPVVV